MIQFRVFGSVELTGPDGEEIASVLSQPKRTALLAFLAAARPRGFHRRDKIVGLFWPEANHDKARASLRRSLHFLRRSLGEGAVEGRGDEELTLASTLIWSDVAAFEEALEAGELESALELYRGDLLDGFFLPECWEFENWLDGERTRLRVRAARAAWALAGQFTAESRLTEAARVAERALELSPTDENEVRGFVEGISAAGDRTTALRFYEKFAALLARELEIDPSPETKALVERIRESEVQVAEVRTPESVVLAEAGSGLLEQPQTSPNSFSQHLKERKILQWALASLGGVFLLYEASETASEAWTFPVLLVQAIHVLLIFGFFVSLVLAWYHGEKVRQWIGGPLLLVLAMLFVLGGIGVSMLGRGENADSTTGIEAASTGVDNPAATLDLWPRLAVLPFTNQSPVEEYGYLANSLHTVIRTELSRIPGLTVRLLGPREEHTEETKRPRQVGEELGVSYLVGADVLGTEETVRVSVHLVDAASESIVWSETFERSRIHQDYLDMQDGIVQAVTEELKVELRQSERIRAARRSATDPQAYDLFLRGLDAQQEGEWPEAASFLQEAVERDQEFVGAQALLARVEARRYRQFGFRSEERAEMARRAAERAVSLAPESGDAQLAMGIYLYWVEKNYETALDWLSRASGTLIGDFEYHRYRGFTERRMGQWRQALASFRGALALSPRSAETWGELGNTLAQMRRYGEAEVALTRMQELGGSARRYFSRLTWNRDGSTDGYHLLRGEIADLRDWEILMTEGRHEEAAAVLAHLPDTIVGQHYWYPKALLEGETRDALAQHPEASREYREAADILESAVREAPDDERLHAGLAWAQAALGRSEKAVREARRAAQLLPRERDALTGPRYLFNLAAVHARLGEVEMAVEVLEDLLRAPSHYSPNRLEDEFRLRPIRDDRRFKALMDRERSRVF